MTAQKCWAASVVLLLCLPLVSGASLSEKLQTIVADNDNDGKSPHMETFFTIDEANRRTSGGSTERSYQHATVGSEDIKVDMDMVVSPKQYARLYLGVRSRSDSHMVATPWTNGVIPYVVENNDFSQEQRDRILGAIKNWENLTCIQFRPAVPHDDNLISIHYGQGCWANLGMKGGRQTVNLDTNGCFWKGTVEHELGHAIGLIHEHQRPQRDGYIRVNFYAVGRSSVDQLTKYARGSDDKMGLDYDYDSVMHYGKTAFARDYASQTIYTRNPDKEDVIGMTLYPSFIDAKLVNLMYQCNAHCQSPPTCQGDCYVDKNCRCFCRSDMPVERCVDRHQNCSQWAHAAECDRNPGFMHDKCRKSCNICNDNGAVPKLPCVNGHSMCDEWARHGECVANAGYMKRSCRLACGLCTPGGGSANTGTCHDTDATTCQARKEKGDCIRKPAEMLKDCKQACDFCPGQYDDPTLNPGGGCEDPDYVCTYYADNGYCYKFYTTMGLKCRKACGTCNKTITLPDGCVDTNPSCGAWAMSGECDVNPGYMLNGCKLSCNNCPGLVVPDVCVDYDMECPDWADRGECTNNPRWMSKNCRKSCGICGDITITPGPCVDENVQCPQWKDMGECSRNPYWMLRHCRKSCNSCQGQVTTPTPVVTTPQAGACVDEKVDCFHWAQSGECSRNPGYMLHHCKKSCGQCGGGTVVPHTTHEPITTPGACQNDNPNCDGWANAGYCDQRPDYMMVHCRLSCHNCTGQHLVISLHTTPATGDCEDTSSYCQSWTQRYQTICQDNPTVAQQCKKTCGTCGGECVDNNKFCGDWAAHGQCDANPQYMHLQCRKSCRICH